MGQANIKLSFSSSFSCSAPPVPHSQAARIQALLEYVVTHNQSYFITYHKLKFDDQYAIADYAINVAPAEVCLSLLP
jgi:hypothetical protein